MSDRVEIRELNIGDLALAQEVVRTLKHAERALPEAELESLQSWLQKPENILIAAFSGNQPIGFALGYLLDRVDGPRPMLFFYEIEVAAPWRRRGVGQRLVGALRRLAVQHGAVKMWVQTAPSNHAAQLLYRSAGAQQADNPDLLFVWDLQTDPKKGIEEKP